MAQQAVKKWERQGKERAGGDSSEVNAELIESTHHKSWEACLGYPMSDWRGMGDQKHGKDGEGVYSSRLS